MATLILRTSCETPNDDENAVDRRRRFPARFEGGASSSSSAADDRHRDVEVFVASRPLQCDVALVPRIPAGDRGDGDRDGHRGDAFAVRERPPPAALRFAGLALNPCGTSSVIVIDRLPPSSPPPVVVVIGGGGGRHRRARDGGADYLISLLRCAVSVPDDCDYDQDCEGGPSPSSSLLPVTASPSTFRVSFADGGDHFLFHPPTVGEVRVSFDYAGAVEGYRDIVLRRRGRGVDDDDDDDARARDPFDDAANCDDIVSGRRRRARGAGNESSHRSHSSSATRRDDDGDGGGGRRLATSSIVRGGGDLASIARSLERESLFVRRALLVLGCAGVALVAALARAMRSIARSKRGGARRRAVDVVVGGGGKEEVGPSRDRRDRRGAETAQCSRRRGGRRRRR